MSSLFAITTAVNSVPLDATRKGQIVFTVSNTSVRAVRGRARIAPDGAAAATWFTLADGAERDFSVNGTQQYTVQIAVPPTVAAGHYTVRLDMVGVDNPDEDFTQGSSVTFAVPEPLPVKRPFPWWIIAVIVGVIIIGIVVAVVLSPKEIEVPNQIGNSLIAAQSTLESAGLKVNVAPATAESSQVNLVVAQDPSGGTKVQSGTGITLGVGVVRPNTPTPTPTATPTATPNKLTTVQLKSSPANSAARGQPVTISAQIKTFDGKTAVGSVTFVGDKNSDVPGCTSPTAVNNGVATCTTNMLTNGAHTVTASYSGDPNHDPSTSSPLALAITPADTSVSISAKVTFSFPAWKVTATATVKNTSTGSTLTPAGKVTFQFTGGGNLTQTCTLNATGTCSISFTNLAILQQVSATYAPSTGDFKASSSSRTNVSK